MAILVITVIITMVISYSILKYQFSVQWQIRWPRLRVEPPYCGVTTGEPAQSQVPNHPQLRLLEINWFGLGVPKWKACLREIYEYLWVWLKMAYPQIHLLIGFFPIKVAVNWGIPHFQTHPAASINFIPYIKPHETTFQTRSS